MPILWGVPPPPRVCKAGIRLLCVRAGQTFHCAVLGPTVGLATHWTGQRTVPCLGNECAFHDQPSTWKGYCPVWVEGYCWQGPAKGRFLWVLVVTEEIGEESLGWTRGLVVTVSRPGKKSNGPMTAQTLSRPIPDNLPDAFDVRPYVMRAAGFSRFSAKKLRIAQG